jgi:TrpR family trp operon transcriptional repressor
MNKKYEKQLIKAFIKASKDEKLFRSFMSDMLTEKEYSEVVRRFEILSRLSDGEAQRTIATDLGLGIATVTRGSHLLLEKGNAFRKLTGN